MIEKKIKDINLLKGRISTANVDKDWNDSLYSPGRYKLFENVTVRGSGQMHVL